MLTIDKYLNNCPEEGKQRLQAIKSLIKTLVPEVQEKISYQMPTFFIEKKQLHFSYAKNHIGIYPGSRVVEDFAEECTLNKLKYSKGAIQLPHNKELPIEFIKKIVQHVFEKN
ncbi:MAG: iron chaperone [Brevinema sp.]